MQYPEIERRDGTLFFAVHEGNRDEISTSIERLIDILDAMDVDPDLEETGDEHDVSMPDRWKPSYRIDPLADYGFVRFVPEDDGDEEENGDFEENGDCEPELGWPEGRDDQTGNHGDGKEGEEISLGWNMEGDLGDVLAAESGRELEEESGYGDVDGIIAEEAGEPELGWGGHGCGFIEGNGLDDSEANGDERDFSGYVGEPMGSKCGTFDGSGFVEAAALLRSIGRTMREPEPGSLFLRTERHG